MERFLSYWEYCIKGHILMWHAWCCLLWTWLVRNFTALHIQFSVPHHITVHFMFLYCYFTLLFSLVYMLCDWKGNSFKIRIWNSEWICFLLSSQGRTLLYYWSHDCVLTQGKCEGTLFIQFCEIQWLVFKILSQKWTFSLFWMLKHECIGTWKGKHWHRSKNRERRK